MKKQEALVRFSDLLIFALALFLAWMSLNGKPYNSAGYGILLFSVMVFRDKLNLSESETTLLIISLSLGAAGWAFGFYSSVRYYDKLLHFITPAFISGIFASMLFRQTRTSVRSAGIRAVAAGVSLGIAWEIVEYSATLMIPSYYMGDLIDTLADIIFDTAGSLTGVLTALLLIKKYDFRPSRMLNK